MPEQVERRGAREDVPEVDRVGPFAEPAQGAAREQRSGRRPRCRDRTDEGDERERGPGDDHQGRAAGVVAVRQHRQEDEGRQCPGREAPHGSGQPTLVQYDRQQRADQDRERVRVGPEVLVLVVLRRAAPAQVEVEDQGDRDAPRRGGGEPPRAAPEAPQQGARPQQVELLLDRQRPRVVEVVPGGERVVRPVEQAGGVGESRAGRRENLRWPEVPPTEEQHDDRRRHDRHEGGAQPRDPAAVERPQVHRAGSQLVEQQRRDQVAREAEEHGHADEPVDERPGRRVLTQDEEDGDATEAVQSRMVTAIAHELVAHVSTVSPSGDGSPAAAADAYSAARGASSCSSSSSASAWQTNSSSSPASTGCSASGT